jgi:diketogulonate reductase-like aldo/keto reductase
MNKRPIPSSGELLPLIGLGTWAQFDVDSSGAQREELTRVLRCMDENGASLIDSSPMYGKAETTVGDLCANLQPDNYFYATKVWTSGKEEGVRQMKDSMRKMKRKAMDLMQVHNLIDYKTHLKTLREWKEKGMVRYIGITHYLPSAHAELERIIKNESIDFVQLNYSIRVKDAEKSLLNCAMDKGVAVLVNEPLEKGSLFSLVKGKPLPDWALAYDIHNWVQFFLKYILAHPAVNCVISGTSDPQHMLLNISAGQGSLPDEQGRKKMIQFLASL